MSDSEIVIRPVTLDDVDAFRELRLEALRTQPIAFGADYADNLARPRGFWVDRIAPGDDVASLIHVADASGELVGLTGIRAEAGPKQKHVGIVWGVFVREAWRGRRLGDRLVNACTEWGAAQGLRYAKLGVHTGNTSAICCYLRCGFSVYAVDPEVIAWEGMYHDELLMAKRLNQF
jgi:RimJ/RimL family protein N-acetyltransferase